MVIENACLLTPYLNTFTATSREIFGRNCKSQFFGCGLVNVGTFHSFVAFI